MIKVGIFGATAYTSLELIKILLKHSQIKISFFAVRREGNPKISTIFPLLKNRIDIHCSGLEEDNIPDDIDLMFVTLPPVIAMNYIPAILKKGIKVIDLSADYRFSNKDIYEKWYKAEHKDPEGIKNSVYGLPEIFREEIKRSVLVANPGCYPTGTILALAPLLKNDLIFSEDIIVDSKSGISGAGREPTEKTHYCERNENIEAYNVGKHRHIPEINHILSKVSGSDISIFFTPHLTPMNRGILNTIYAKKKENTNINDIEKAFQESYSNRPFVRIKEDSLPRVADVTNTNFCDIAFTIVKNRIIIISCIDNLIKGASGQAVQNMNLMLGFDEAEAIF